MYMQHLSWTSANKLVLCFCFAYERYYVAPLKFEYILLPKLCFTLRIQLEPLGNGLYQAGAFIKRSGVKIKCVLWCVPRQEESGKTLGFCRLSYGGEKGIRTLVTVPRKHDFQSCALDQLSHLSAMRLACSCPTIIHHFEQLCKRKLGMCAKNNQL